MELDVALSSGQPGRRGLGSARPLLRNEGTRKGAGTRHLPYPPLGQPRGRLPLSLPEEGGYHSPAQGTLTLVLPSGRLDRLTGPAWQVLWPGPHCPGA